MPKSPADPGSPPAIPPCEFLGAVEFICKTVLTIGFDGGSLYKPVPPPPGGILPPLTYTGTTIWNCDVFSGAQHWGANLNLSCPGINPAGSITLFFADVTGTYTCTYILNPTDKGQGDYPTTDTHCAPLVCSVVQG